MARENNYVFRQPILAFVSCDSNCKELKSYSTKYQLEVLNNI